MPNYADSYEDADGNVWQFDAPYDDDPIEDWDELPPTRAVDDEQERGDG